MKIIWLYLFAFWLGLCAAWLVPTQKATEMHSSYWQELLASLLDWAISGATW